MLRTQMGSIRQVIQGSKQVNERKIRGDCIIVTLQVNDKNYVETFMFLGPIIDQRIGEVLLDEKPLLCEGITLVEGVVTLREYCNIIGEFEWPNQGDDKVDKLIGQTKEKWNSVSESQSDDIITLLAINYIAKTTIQDQWPGTEEESSSDSWTIISDLDEKPEPTGKKSSQEPKSDKKTFKYHQIHWEKIYRIS
jgi:hypothetical protein